MTSRIVLVPGYFVGAMLLWVSAGLSVPAAAQGVSHGSESGRMTDAAIVKDLRASLDMLVRKDEFSGDVLLAKHGRILFEHAYGDADKAFDVPNRLDTKFNLGSMGKIFTGVAVLQLAQAGKLSLDDKLIKDLPDYPNKAIAREVTIRQLLTHTAGFGDFFGPKFFETSKDQLSTLQSLLPLFVNEPLLFKPGTSWSYSNAGFIVLGLVIEHVTGESYYDYVRRHIFEPAGMHDTGNEGWDTVVPDRAVGYTRDDQSANAPRKSNIFFLQRGGSAGGGYSTVGDLLRFAEALQSDKLLNKKYTTMDMTGQVVTPRPGVKYGFGMEEEVVNGIRIVGHGGGGPGIQSVLDMYPDLGYVVVILTNYENAMSLVDGRLRFELTGQRVPSRAAVGAAALQGLAGSYVPIIPPGAHVRFVGSPPPITVKIGVGVLEVNPGMGPDIEFIPTSPDEFVDRDDPGRRIIFVRDASGKITALKTATGFGPVPPITARRVAKSQH